MLSIIIPTLDEEKYLPILLSQIKKQNFSDFEIIVADAGSKDKTVEIAKSFGCQVTNGGLPAKGRNEGAKITRGEIFLFLDADNIFLPENFLKNLLEEFEKRNLGVASFPIYPAGNWFDKIAYFFLQFLDKNFPKLFAPCHQFSFGKKRSLRENWRI
jgi:glycosyltransferase involved in cell wall biosynthesis